MADVPDADATANSVSNVDVAKQALRREMRQLRNGLSNRSERSVAIWSALLDRDDVRTAHRVMVFASIPGEPETALLIEQLHAAGKLTALPEDADLDPSWPDMVVVPGLAFTVDGHRLGQGGGWYDRFLPRRRADCTTIGVCFAPQLVDNLPTDEHDVTLDAIVTD
jgi:5-formyltetrahydrofolate cyclo-ligase